MPGMAGKGFQFESGEIVTWVTDREGSPWHSDKCYELTGDRYDYSSPITIEPGGLAVSTNELRANPAPADGGEDAIIATHNILRRASKDQYLAAGAKSYAHADKIAALTPASKHIPASLVDLFERIVYVKDGIGVQPVRVIMGTKTWTRDGRIDDTRYNVAGLFPGKCKAHTFQKRLVATHERHNPVWGFDTLTVDVLIPSDAQSFQVIREIGQWLETRFAADEDFPSLVFFAHGAAPIRLEDAAMSKHVAQKKVEKAARNLLLPTDDECTLVIDTLNAKKEEAGKRVFTNEKDLATASGLPRDRLVHIMPALLQKNIVDTGGFSTPTGNMGSWFALH